MKRILNILIIAAYSFSSQRALGTSGCVVPEWFNANSSGSDTAVGHAFDPQLERALEKADHDLWGNLLGGEATGQTSGETDKAHAWFFRLALRGIQKDRRYEYACGGYYVVTSVARSQVGDAFKEPQLVEEMVRFVNDGRQTLVLEELNWQMVWREQAGFFTELQERVMVMEEQLLKWTEDSPGYAAFRKLLTDQLRTVKAAFAHSYTLRDRRTLLQTKGAINRWVMQMDLMEQAWVFYRENNLKAAERTLTNLKLQGVDATGPVLAELAGLRKQEQEVAPDAAATEVDEMPEVASPGVDNVFDQALEADPTRGGSELPWEGKKPQPCTGPCLQSFE